MNLGVYVSTLNEDVLIEHTLLNVRKVFPQVEVIDLGSTDNTHSILNRLEVPYHVHRFVEDKESIAGAQWTALKNEYANKHDWVFFIDGDEVYDIDNLQKIQKELDSPQYTAYRIGWKVLRKSNANSLTCSDILINGTKVYKTTDYYFRRAWPAEVLQATKEELDNKQPKEDCKVWCWHGVLLNRSTNREDTARKKKRVSKDEQYATELTWTSVEELPWM